MYKRAEKREKHTSMTCGHFSINLKPGDEALAVHILRQAHARHVRV